MPAREDRHQKAARLLREQRLHVRHVSGEWVEATCKGDSGTYELGYDDGRGWFCNCPAFGRDCSHLVALIWVTVPATPGPSPTMK